MFTLAQETVDTSGSHPHLATLNDPNHLTLRPVGFPENDPFNTYEVSVSFEEFYFDISIIPGEAALRLQEVIRRGYQNNSKPVDEIKESLIRDGWEPSIELRNDFRVRATHHTLHSELPEIAGPNAVLAALKLSGLCLNYLVVTRMRQPNLVKAVHRNVNTQFNSDPWEMDPSERDRQTIGHRQLENWLIDELRSYGIQAFDPGYGESSIQFDLAWDHPDGSLVVCEVKTTTNNEVKQIRLGVGQVLHYAVQLEEPGRKIIPCLLVQSTPEDGSLMRLAESNGVRLFSPDETSVLRKLVTTPSVYEISSQNGTD